MADPQLDARKLAKLLQSIGLRYGLVVGEAPGALTPLVVELAAEGNQFSHGVLACLAEIVRFVEQPASGGQSLGDLLLEPRGQDVEGPGGCGRND